MNPRSVGAIDLQPVKHSGDLWLELLGSVGELLPAVDGRKLRIIQLDRESDGGAWQAWAGLSRARTELRRAAAKGEAPRPHLLIGLSGRPDAERLSPSLQALLSWPGIACVGFGFDADRFREIAAELINGATAPLPVGVLPSADDVETLQDLISRARNLRHWLRDNRLNNAEGELANLREVARGDLGLHHSMVEPAVALTDAHRQELAELCDPALVPAELATDVTSFSTVRGALAAFESHWAELEVRRAELRGSKSMGSSLALAELIEMYVHVCDVLREADCKLASLIRELREYIGEPAEE